MHPSLPLNFPVEIFPDKVFLDKFLPDKVFLDNGKSSSIAGRGTRSGHQFPRTTK